MLLRSQLASEEDRVGRGSKAYRISGGSLRNGKASCGESSMILACMPGTLSDAAARVRYGLGSDSTGIGSAEDESSKSWLVTGF